VPSDLDPLPSRIDHEPVRNHSDRLCLRGSILSPPRQPAYGIPVSCSMHRRRGLSIIELLVVIAIILIVAAIIITVLAKLYRVVKALGGPHAAIILPVYGEEQPAANADWKQTKSATFSTGGMVEPSQLA
jgi:prepilin-type N-terminal cleavage/methylation domain-containing protein